MRKKERKPIYKRVWFLVVVIILFVVVLIYWASLSLFPSTNRKAPYYECAFLGSKSLECMIEDIPDISISEYINNEKKEQGNIYFYVSKNLDTPLINIPSDVVMEELDLTNITVTHRCSNQIASTLRDSFMFIIKYPSLSENAKIKVMCNFIGKGG